MTELIPQGRIYQQYEAAFAQVSAYVICSEGQDRVATIAFKFPPRGHGERRVYAYVHWLGLPMVRGWASGGGYDKRTAACSSAMAKLWPTVPLSTTKADALGAFYFALKSDTGPTWQSQLETAGFIVLQAV